MTNFERYAEQIRTILYELKQDFAINKYNNIMFACGNVNCSDCLFGSSPEECSVIKLKWCVNEYKGSVKIYKATQIILENIHPRYRYIAKDADGKIKVFEDKPSKTLHGYWTGYGKNACLEFNDNLFNFLSWRDEEPIHIETLLLNCEVID